MALEGLINVITLVPGSAKTPKTPHAHHYALELDSSFFFVPPSPSKSWALYSCMWSRLCVRSFLSRFAKYIFLQATEHMTRLMRMLRGKMRCAWFFFHR